MLGVFQSVEPWQLHKKANLGAPHTTHCLGSGEVLISCMGDENENAKGKYKKNIEDIHKMSEKNNVKEKMQIKLLMKMFFV